MNFPFVTIIGYCIVMYCVVYKTHPRPCHLSRQRGRGWGGEQDKQSKEPGFEPWYGPSCRHLDQFVYFTMYVSFGERFCTSNTIGSSTSNSVIDQQ